MPSNQGIRLDDDQRLPPFEEPREQRHGETNRIGRSLSSLLPFQKQGPVASAGTDSQRRAHLGNEARS
jgi:hypothetical protein